MPQTAGKPEILETGSTGEQCATELDLFFPLHPGQTVFNIVSSCGKLLNRSRDSRDLQPQPLPPRLCSLGEWDNQGLGAQLPHSYFTPSFDFILYSYFFNIIEYNLFYIMYTNYITMLYRAKHELHGKNWEKNDEVLCTAKPPFSPCSVTSQDALNLLGSSNLTNYWPQGELCPSPACSPPLQSTGRAGAPLLLLLLPPALPSPAASLRTCHT